MPNSVAEAYLLIVRESFVPIIGEAVPFPFTGQIELDSWKWDLKNDQRVKPEGEPESEGGTSGEASSDGTEAQLVRASSHESVHKLVRRKES